MKTGLATLLAVLAVLLLVAAGLGRQDTSTPVQGDASGLRVVTYNIRHGQGNDDCDDEEAAEGTPPAAQCAVDLERTVDVISSLEPDILAIQEVDRFWARSGGVDQPTELVESLGMSACFGVNLNHEPDEHADEPHQYGTATLTMFPILDCDNTFLPTSEGWEQRGLLETRVEIEGVGEVAILNTHLQAGRQGQEEEAIRQRTEQAEFIADRIAAIDVPVILMGDFNAEPDDDELAPLRDSELGLQDAWDIAGDEDDGSEGFTSPTSPDEDAERRIDYIFVSGDIEVLSVDVPVTEDTRMASDHFPVMADLALADPEATPIVSPDVTPEPTPIVETPPDEDPTVIIAPIEEPAETPTPAAEEDADSDEDAEPNEDAVPTQAPPTPVTTDEPVAEPTEDQEPTAEPALPTAEEPEAEPTEDQEPTAEPELPPTDEPEAAPTEDAAPPVEGTTEPAPEETAEPVTGGATNPASEGPAEPAFEAVGEPVELPVQPPAEPAEPPSMVPAAPAAEEPGSERDEDLGDEAGTEQDADPGSEPPVDPET